MSVVLIILSFQRGKLFLCATPAACICLYAVPMYVTLPLFTQQVAITDFDVFVFWAGGVVEGEQLCVQQFMSVSNCSRECVSHTYSAALYI